MGPLSTGTPCQGRQDTILARPAKCGACSVWPVYAVLASAAISYVAAIFIGLTMIDGPGRAGQGRNEGMGLIFMAVCFRFMSWL